MKLKTVIFFLLTLCFFFSTFSGNGLGASLVSICLTVLFAWLGWRSIKKPAADKKPEVSKPAAFPAFPVKEEKASPYEFLKIKVAGVTFENGHKSRQSILRAIKFRDGEFVNGVELELRKYEYEGQDAYGIYANGQQIGNVPKDMVQYITDNYSRIDCFSHIEVYGGGRDEDMNVKNYGCEVTLRLNK